MSLVHVFAIVYSSLIIRAQQNGELLEAFCQSTYVCWATHVNKALFDLGIFHLFIYS